MRFSTFDWTLVAVYVLLAFAIGMLARKRITNIADYLVAGRHIRYNLGVASLVATELGLVTMMYFAEQGYRFGFAAFIIGVIWAAAYFMIGRTGFVVERIRQLEIITITEYFQVRYSRGVRVLAASLLTIAGVLSLGVFLKLGAVFIVNYTDIPATSLHLTMTVLVVIVVIYTILGGMVSVVLTDYVQFVFLAIGMLMASAFVLQHHGFIAIFEKAGELYGAGAMNPFTHPEYGWTFIAYWAVFAVSGCVLWQPVAQRVLASENPELNRRIFKSTSVMFLGRAFFPILWGIGAALYFGAAGDPTAGMPKFLAEILPVGILGFLAAGMFAALMSTDDSYLIAWSGIIVQDLIAPLRGKEISGAGRVMLTRICVFVIGVLMLIFGIWYELKDSAFRYLLDVTTIYYAGGLPVLVAGLYWKRASLPGAYLAFAFGAFLPLAFVAEDIILQARGITDTGFFNELFSPNMRGLMSFVLGFIGMGIGSILTSTKPALTDKRF